MSEILVNVHCEVISVVPRSTLNVPPASEYSPVTFPSLSAEITCVALVKKLVKALSPSIFFHV